MKGVVFNLLEEVVRQDYGLETWDDLLEVARVHGAYTSLGNYPDEELTRLVAAASDGLRLPADEVIRWFGRNALGLMAEKYPEFFAGHPDTRSFLLTLNDIIHPEVRKLYPGAQVPDFGFDTSSPEGLSLTYDSPRNLCAFAEGLIQGAAVYFGETALITQPECMHRGDRQCLIRIRFRSAEEKHGGT